MENTEKQLRSAPLDRIEVGDTDYRPKNGGEHDAAGRNAEQEVLERGRDIAGGLRHIRNNHGGGQCGGGQSSDGLLLQ